MKAIKGLFFDLDGTLADTFAANFVAYTHAFQKIGRQLDAQMYKDSYGMRLDRLMPKMFNDITTEEIEIVKTEKARVYKQNMHLVKPNQQLIDFVKTLRPHHTITLVTMAQKPNALAVLETLELKDMFDFIITGEQVKQSKPHPEVYLKALEISGISADEALAFEDSDEGIESARKAGMATIRIRISERHEN